MSPAVAAARSSHDAIRVSRSFFGLHDASQRAYDHVSFGALRIWDAGATWKDVETAPGHYDWTHLDSLVAGAQDHRVQVTLVLGMTPSFYAARASRPPSHLRAFRNYVHAVMARYRDFRGRRGISAYQVWNEGNVSTFWTGTPHRLAELTRLVDRVRDDVDPRAKVVAPSFAVRLQGERRWLAAFQSQRLSGRPVWSFYDVNALSLYPKASYDGRLGAPEDAMALLRQVRRQFARVGVPRGRPIWASEINYGVGSGSAGPVGVDPLSDRRQVANVLRTYLLAAANGLGRVFWYRYDWGEVPGVGALANTLLSDPNDANRISPAGRALSTVEHWLQGRIVLPSGRHAIQPNSQGTYVLVVRHRGGLRKIYWNPGHVAQVRARGADVLQDQAGADTRLAGRTATLRVDYRPVMLDWRR